MNRLKSWWLNHKTKALGLLTVLAIYGHDNIAQVQALFSRHPQWYGYAGYALGGLVTLLGFLNSSQQQPPS